MLSKFFKKSSPRTKGTYGQKIEPDAREVTTSLPRAPVKPAVTHETPNPSKDDTVKKDDEIREAEGADLKKETVQTGGDDKIVAVKSNVPVRSEATASDFQAGGNFTAFWNETVDYDLVPISYSSESEWTPNSIAMFSILAACSTYVVNHRDIVKMYPHYFDYAVACYYAILFYVQILRARKSAGMLTANESRFLRQFERDNKPEELVIAGPLVAYFNTIVACRTEDARFGWFAPRVATELMHGTMADFDQQNGAFYLQPMVPYMLSILRMMTSKEFSFAQLWTTTHHNAANSDYVFIDDEDRLVPYVYGNAQIGQDHTLWGIRTNNNARQLTMSQLLSAAGVSYPIFNSPDDLNVGKRWWNNSNMKQLNTVPLDFKNVADTEAQVNAPGNLPNTYSHDGTTNIAGIENFLMMQRDARNTWFKDLAEQATIHAKMFKGAENLSKIATVGGNEPLIIAQFHAARSHNAKFYNDIPGDRTAANIEWYHNQFNAVSSSFFTSIAEPSREERLQAMTFATNANLHIRDANPAGGATALSIATDGHSVGSIGIQRSGPFFENLPEIKGEYGLEMRNGKEMFNEFKSVIGQKFARERLVGMNA